VSAPPITDGRPVLGLEHAGVDCVIEGSRTLGWRMWPLGRALGADRLDRRGTHPGDPTPVASPRRVALHAPQRDRPRSDAANTLMSGEAASSGVLDTIDTGHTSGSRSPG